MQVQMLDGQCPPFVITVVDLVQLMALEVLAVETEAGYRLRSRTKCSM